MNKLRWDAAGKLPLILLAGLVAWVCVSSGVAMAEWSIFGHHRGGDVGQVEQDLEANPSLVNDQNYLSGHPRLAKLLERHPEAKAQIQQDPKGFFEALKAKRQQRQQQQSQSEQQQPPPQPHQPSSAE